MFYYLATTPIEARQNPYVYTAIVFAGLFALIFFGINYLINKIKERNEKLSKMPDSVTSKINIKNLQKILKLTEEEAHFLYKLCKINNVPNLELRLKDETFINGFVKTQFELINSKNIPDKENLINILFSIRNKIDVHKNKASIINNSINMKVNLKMSYIENDINQYDVTLVDNSEIGFTITSPVDIFNVRLPIEGMSKITLFFEANNNIAYILQSRVLRILSNGNILIAHTTNIQPLQRRIQKRINLNTPCTFSAVQVAIGGNSKSSQMIYTPMKKKHQGKIADISVDGCCLLCDMDIKENQYIHLEINIDGTITDEIIGTIVNTHKVKENEYKLHIRFVRISQKVRNKIFSQIYINCN